jgi:predicted nucleic acid-binding protein
VIIADTNLIGYLLIQGPFTADAERVLQKDPEWAAPLLWRSELCSVLSQNVRAGTISQTGAEAHFRRADQLILPETYDCEFAWTARAAGVKLVTADKKLLVAFPGLATSVQNFAVS